MVNAYPIAMKLCTVVLLIAGANAAYFAHMTDFHLSSAQPYAPGTKARCEADRVGMPCCRRDEIPYEPKTGTPQHACSKWGDGNADAPWGLINASVSFLAESFGQELDFAVMTGDLPGHFLIDQSPKSNMHAIFKISELLYERLFPTRVFPVLGNHDGCPLVDQEGDPPFDRLCTRKILPYWSRWFPDDASFNSSFEDWGFYVAAHPTVANVSIIGLNTLWEDKHDILPDKTGRAAQRKWLTDTLTRLETLGHQAWLIGHVYPSSSEDDSNYTDFMYTTLTRFNSTLRYFYFGHTHLDETFVMANGCATFWCPGSVTPFHDHEPCVRVYDYEPSSGRVNDFMEFCTTLDDGWDFRLRYKASDYGLAGMEKADYLHLFEQMKANTTLATLYYNHSLTGGPYVPCDRTCLDGVIDRSILYR